MPAQAISFRSLSARLFNRDFFSKRTKLDQVPWRTSSFVMETWGISGLFFQVTLRIQAGHQNLELLNHSEFTATLIYCADTQDLTRNQWTGFFHLRLAEYVTILRNIVENFESVFNFYHLREVFGMEATRTNPWRNSWKNQCHITLSTAADFLRA